jgi:hypothetical protein
MTDSKLAGISMIVLAIAFNAVFAWLGAIFDYPDILRRAPAEILTRFGAGGPTLIFAWAAFMFSAAWLVPTAGWLSAVTHARGVATTAALACGVAAGLAQAIGLARWVFVVPGLAAATPGETVTLLFHAIHQYGGVAIGEQLGQFFTALWVLLLAGAQARGALPIGWASLIGIAASALIFAGLAEAYATVLAFDPGPLALAAPVGFMLLSLWMLITGVGLLLARD